MVPFASIVLRPDELVRVRLPCVQKYPQTSSEMDICNVHFPTDHLSFLALRTRVFNIVGPQELPETCKLALQCLVDCATAFWIETDKQKIVFDNLSPVHPAAETLLLVFGLEPKQAQVRWLTFHCTLRLGKVSEIRPMTTQTFQKFVAFCLQAHPKMGWQ